MGAEVLVPLAISALSAGAATYNTVDTARRADRVAAQGITQQADTQRRADERVNQEIQTLEGSTPEDSRAAANNDYLTALRRNRSNAVGEDLTGATSSAYTADTAAAKTGVTGYGTRVADTMSRIAAPGRQRQAEGEGFAQLASNLQNFSRESQGNAFLQSLRQRSVTRNPWVDAGATIGSGVAGGMAANSGTLDDGTLTSVMDNGYVMRTPRPKTKFTGYK